ncbi:MAG: ribosome maturation factor RimP [Epsilonproteobacteria bacterium]|nr:ribosome maturation factor RimP [Campylobacterota bacterium]
MELEEEIKIVVEGCGMSLYDIVQVKENDNNIYRIYITSPDGVSLDKCEEISRMVAPILDIKEPMRGKYLLEVSSPGIERKLKKLEHLQSSVGENVKGKLFDGGTFKGKLLSFDELNKFTFQSEDGDHFTFQYSAILSASTYYNW